MRHTKLLNSIWVLFANHNVPWMGTYLKVTAHFSVVPFNRLAAYLYCSIAPSLEVRQRRLICKALEVRADTTQISSVHAIAKCLVQMLPSFLGMNQKLIKVAHCQYNFNICEACRNRTKESGHAIWQKHCFYLDTM